MPSQYTEDESARPIGAPPSIIHAMRPINLNVTAPQEGIHLERLARRKTAASGPSIPSGSPTSLTLFRLHRSSISVIFSVSRSSWSFKSVTVRLSSRAAAWTESTRSRVCFVLVTMASNSSLSSLTDLLVASMSSRSSRNAESAQSPPHLSLPSSQPNSKCFGVL